ncbi:MAG TPA: DMT family transporter [Paracoccaceae bacterium]|nr:DMT family transporter [Paracoccaceae bacterium]
MDLTAILMGIAFVVMWSSAFTSARMIVADAPPLTALALRFLISGLIGVGLAAAAGQSARLTAAQWRGAVIFGLCQNALYLGLYFVAMQRIEAGLASILASTMPLIVAVAGWGLYGERLRPLAWVGLAAGFAGVALIMGGRFGGAGGDAFGLALCIAGVSALAFATLAVRGATSGGNLLMVVGLQMLVGSAALAAAAALTETLWWNPTPRLFAAFAYTTLVPGLLATWVWFRLVSRIGAVRAAAFHFLNPFFGVLIAWALLGEALSWVDVLGVAVVAAGILAVQLARNRT